MVEFIKYNNEKYPVRISNYALRMLKQETGKSLEDFKGDDALEAYEPLIYYSLVSGARAEKVELKLTREDAFDVIEDCFFEFVNLLPKFFPNMDKEGQNISKKPMNRQQKRAQGKK